MRWAYLAFVLVSTAGMLVVDLRWRLVLFRRSARARALLVVAVGAVLFLVWDVLAIERGFYQRGDSPGMSGVEVADELPIEELFFIVFLCYITLVLHSLFRLLLTGPTRRSAAAPLVDAGRREP